MANAVRFKSVSVPRQKGEVARFKVIQGPDYGAIYVILSSPASIGRGEDNDIVISDLKSSRNHAELFANQAGWFVKDKGSANGILVNGKASRESAIKINDTVTLGETTLEFTTSDVGTMMLVAPPRTMEQAQADLKQKNSIINNAANIFQKESTKTIGASTSSGNSNNRIKLYAIVGVLLLGFFLLPEKKQKTVKNKNQDQSLDISSVDLGSFLPNSEVNRASDTLFKDGLREYFQGNFNRARTQFETVLQISPGHPLATLYLNNCDQAIKDEVKLHLEYGKKSLDSGKLREARAHYERIKRLLYKAESDPQFVEANAQLEVIKKKLKGDSKDP